MHEHNLSISRHSLKISRLSIFLMFLWQICLAIYPPKIPRATPCSFLFNVRSVAFFSSLLNLPSSDLLINLLVSSLSRALSFNPPLAGRLAADADGPYFIACTDAGVDFVRAVAPGLSSTDVAVRDSDVPDVIKELFLLNGVVNLVGCSTATCSKPRRYWYHPSPSSLTLPPRRRSGTAYSVSLGRPCKNSRPEPTPWAAPTARSLRFNRCVRSYGGR